MAAGLAGRSLQEYPRARLIELASRPDAETLRARIRARKAATAASLPAEAILRHKDEDRRGAGRRAPDPPGPDRLIGEEGAGFRIALATLDHTRVTIAAQALGIAQGALDYATGYVRERRQFGKAIADFQGVQFMLADMAMKVETARQLTQIYEGHQPDPARGHGRQLLR